MRLTIYNQEKKTCSNQRCPSRLKSCRCRTAMVYKKSYRAAAATRWLIKNLTAPLPRWFSKKCSKFHCRDCIGPEILVLDHQIHSVSGCFICKHWNSTKFMQFFNVLEKNAAAITFSKTCRNRPTTATAVAARQR